MNQIKEEQWKWVAVSQLRMAPWNYKETEGRKVVETKKKLVSAMEKRGVILNLLVRPIGVESGYPVYEVVNGNHRLEIFHEKKILEAMCVDLGEISQQEAELIALETNELQFDSDPLKLASLIRDVGSIYSDDVIVETAPYTLVEVKGYTRELPSGESQDEIPEIPKLAKSKRGELWTLGNHRLLIDDCTVKENAERLMGEEKADMVFTDPPYNVASESKNFAQDKSKSMKDLANAEWDKGFDINPALDRVRDAVAENCTVYVWTSQWLVEKIWQHLNGWCDYTGYCVWAKPNPMPSLSKRHWTWATELCVYGSLGSKRTVNFPSEGHALNWWSDVKKSDGTHPTQKPIEICERPIEFSSMPNAVVLDLFLGSGSTLIACEKTNRRCYGMEIEPLYGDVILSRFAKFSGKDPVREDGVTWSSLCVAS
jgi:DNA modification methylase